jgi:hypothetical protein
VQGARARGHPGRPCRLHPELLCRGVPVGHRDRRCPETSIRQTVSERHRSRTK